MYMMKIINYPSVSKLILGGQKSVLPLPKIFIFKIKIFNAYVKYYKMQIFFINERQAFYYREKF